MSWDNQQMKTLWITEDEDLLQGCPEISKDLILEENVTRFVARMSLDLYNGVIGSQNMKICHNAMVPCRLGGGRQCATSRSAKISWKRSTCAWSQGKVRPISFFRQYIVTFCNTLPLLTLGLRSTSTEALRRCFKS